MEFLRLGAHGGSDSSGPSTFFLKKYVGQWIDFEEYQYHSAALIIC